jgi:hypothetical protein
MTVEFKLSILINITLLHKAEVIHATIKCQFLQSNYLFYILF